MTSITSYRSRCEEFSYSDSSSSSDDDDQPWKRQKRKRNERVRETPMAVSCSVERPARPVSESHAPSNKRKRNNIWGEVVQAQEEEQVARDMTHFDMHQNKERDVESYNYRRSDMERKPQPLGNPISFGDNSDVRNRKMPAALGGSNEDSWLVDEGRQEAKGTRIIDRLGTRTDCMDSEEGMEEATFSPTMKAVTIEPNMHKKEVAGQIAYSLQEPNRDMVKTVVYELGVEKAVAVWKETCNIERNGGMMVNTGLRRRTPGGVFFYMLKMDQHISKEKKDIIFAMSKLQAKQDSKDRRRKRRRGKHRNKGTRQEGKAKSMEVEASQQEKAIPTEQGEETNLMDSEMKLKSVVDVVAEKKQEGGDKNVMDSEMKQEQDYFEGNTNGKIEEGFGRDTHKIGDREANVKVNTEMSGTRDEKAGESDKEKESSSSSEEEEEADIGKAIERRLLEIKREKEKNGENREEKADGSASEKEVQKGDNCARGKGEQIRSGEDAEMEEGEVSD